MALVTSQWAGLASVFREKKAGRKMVPEAEEAITQLFISPIWTLDTKSSSAGCT